MADYVAISGLVIAILGGIATAVNTVHITECECCCIKSDCVERARTRYKSTRSGSTLITPPPTPPSEATPIQIQPNERW